MTAISAFTRPSTTHRLRTTFCPERLPFARAYLPFWLGLRNLWRLFLTYCYRYLPPP